jgi:superfamily I DNA/RNA helicase
MKMAINVKDGNFYMVGDADQTIFEFAGSDPDYFHKLSKDAQELREWKKMWRNY